MHVLGGHIYGMQFAAGSKIWNEVGGWDEFISVVSG